MDRKRLDLLVAKANALANALRGTSDTNDNAKQRCLVLAAEVQSFVKAWSNVAKALHDPQLQFRPAFSQIIDRILNDCVKIIHDLGSHLSDVKTRQAQHDAAAQSMKWLPKRRTTHLLVSFFGRENINLRQLQIRYAIAVLDVILGVVFHAKTLGYEPSTQQDAQTSLQDQLARLRAESDARILVLREECRIGNQPVASSQWLDSVTWDSDSFGVPPFETLALQWFEDAEDDDRQLVASGADSHDLVRAVKQMEQNLREQDRRHDQQTRKFEEQSLKYEQENAALRLWAKDTITQLQFSQQKTKREADSRIEEMMSQLEVQKQKIESDAAIMQQLRYSQQEWGSNFQRQSRQFQQLEARMEELKKTCSEQQARLESLQHDNNKLQSMHDKLAQQNQKLRHRLGESEAQRQLLEAENGQLQTRYARTLSSGKRYKDLYEAGSGDREAQIEEMQEGIQAFKAEIASLRSELARVTGNRDELRQSLTMTEKQRDRYKERLDSVKPPCPTIWDGPTSPTSRRRSSSRRRVDYDTGEPSTPAGTSRGSSRHSTSRSRTSSATYVNDSASESEQGRDRSQRRSGSTAASSLSSWFSTKPKHRPSSSRTAVHEYV